MEIFYLSISIIFIYVGWIAFKLGFHQRIPLVFSKFSFEQIPTNAAKRHRDRIVATTDDPVLWMVPQLKVSLDQFTWSANRINDTIGFMAAMLTKQHGFIHANRVAIVKKNHFDYQIINAAVVRAGGIACPMHVDFLADKLKPYLNNIGAKILISDVPTLFRLLSDDADLGCVESIILADSKNECDQKQISHINDTMNSLFSDVSCLWIEDELIKINAPMKPIKRGKDEPLVLTHTSGTTGFPKSVILKNAAQCLAARGILALSGLSRNDLCYMALPYNHLATLATFNSLLMLGVKAHWTSKCKFDFNPKDVLATLADQKFTAFMGFPITYTQLANQPLGNYDLSAMRIWACTADACHEVIQRKLIRYGNFFKPLGLPIKGSIFIDALGSSETGIPVVVRFVTSLTNKYDRRIGIPGIVPFAPKTKVINANGKEVAKGEIGRFYVKGKTVTEGYWNNHSKTYLEARDGWLFTGDIVRREFDGHIIQLDREVDVIHTANGDVFTLPIEEKIHKHEAIFDACVFGARQGDKTQLPAAAVATRQGTDLTEEQLLRQLNDMLSNTEQLCDLKILPWDRFPMGLTGKTLKRAFRDQTEKNPVFEDNRPVGT